MIQFVVAAGLAFFFLREGMNRNKQEDASEDEVQPGGIPTPDPEPQPAPPSMDYTQYASWSGEATVGDNVVWTFQKMIRYSDGSTEKDGSQYVVIGNADHTEFVRQNSSRGAINIKWEYTGRADERDSQNVVVFPSIEAAVSYLEDQQEDDPNDPTGPQRQPEDDDSTPTQPSFPTQPGYGLGGGGMTPFQNGGI